MNYEAHYERLISRARGRVLDVYKERHHVLPRCMGGDNSPDNLVDLTPEEHYVAHQLLVKIHPTVRGLAHAAARMSKQCTGNKPFGWLRRRVAIAISELHKGTKRPKEWGAKISAAQKGRKLKPESIAKRSALRRGMPMAPGTRAALAKANIGNKHTAGRVLSPEERAKRSVSQIGKKMSPEAIRKTTLANIGKTVSPETRAKLSLANKGRLTSPEQRAKNIAVLEAYQQRRRQLKQGVAP